MSSHLSPTWWCGTVGRGMFHLCTFTCTFTCTFLCNYVSILSGSRPLPYFLEFPPQESLVFMPPPAGATADLPPGRRGTLREPSLEVVGAPPVSCRCVCGSVRRGVGFMTSKLSCPPWPFRTCVTSLHPSCHPRTHHGILSPPMASPHLPYMSCCPQAGGGSLVEGTAKLGWASRSWDKSGSRVRRCGGAIQSVEWKVQFPRGVFP